MGSFQVNPQSQFIVGYDENWNPVYSDTFGDMGYQADPYWDYWSQFMGNNYDPYSYLNYYNDPSYYWDPYGGSYMNWQDPWGGFDPNDPNSIMGGAGSASEMVFDPATGTWSFPQAGGGVGGGGGGGQTTPNPLPGIYPGGMTEVGLPQTPFTTAEPLQMAEQNRLLAKSWGDAMDQSIRDAINAYQGQEAGFLDWSLYGPGGYSNILGGMAGFTPEQQANLLQDEMLRNALVSGSELEGQYLSPDEYASVAGSPYAARDITAGQLPGLWSMQDEAQKRQREGYQYLEGLLGSAVDPNALRVSEGYYPEVQGIIGDTATGFGEIIDPRFLGLSEEFLTNYNVSPRDMQDIEDRAGRLVGLRSQAQREALERSAAAAGNTSPLALQNAVDRGRIYGDIGAADAMTGARIQAKQLGLDTARTREGMRLGTEQDIASRATDALKYLSGTSLDAANIYEQMRRAAEQDISNRLMATGSEVGQTKLRTEADIGRQQQELGRYGTGLISGLTQYGESEAARRAADLATNRQNVGYQNIDTRFGQYYPASTALSGRYGQIYGQQKGEEAEGRGFLTGQQQQAQQGALTSRQQRLQAGGTMLSGVNQPTGYAIQAKYIPTWFDKIVGAAGGAFGGG